MVITNIRLATMNMRRITSMLIIPAGTTANITGTVAEMAAVTTVAVVVGWAAVAAWAAAVVTRAATAVAGITSETAGMAKRT